MVKVIRSRNSCTIPIIQGVAIMQSNIVEAKQAAGRIHMHLADTQEGVAE